MSVMSISMGSGETSETRYIGRAAEDLPDNSTSLKIIVPQLSPAASGGVAASRTESIISTESPDGVTTQTKATTSNTITAVYIGLSNFKYPPTVRKGEQVMVYQFGDSDQYYWRSMGRDPELRKLEVLRIEVSDKTDTRAALTDSNTYFFEMDTKVGHVKLQTAKTNNEAVRYSLHLNGKEGLLDLKDDIGNLIHFDSQKPQIRVSNKDGSVLDLTGKIASLIGPDSAVIQGGKQILLDSPNLTMRNTKGTGITKLEFNELALEGKAMTTTAPVIGLNGQVTTSSSIIAGGAIQATGYSTGTGTPAYTAATTDIVKGTGAGGDNSVNGVTVNPGTRHAAAYEELLELAQRLEDMLNEVKTSLGVPVNVDGELTAIATASKMPKNQGE